ncbi:MAG: hypothetical protein MRECE_5c019 [Mycoplasmataceae bacterium CE_OT135]|nr:MAG: hypothetical protein MRECE_5c019 [Mycoplasmataceae bacterium CE_OT135]
MSSEKIQIFKNTEPKKNPQLFPLLATFYLLNGKLNH